MPDLAGMLLLAAPGLADPNFRRSAVLVIDHDGDGALGVILNRPANLTVGEVVPELSELAGEHARIHQGGPVQPDGLVVLADFTEPGDEQQTVLGSVALVSGADDIESLIGTVERARVFAGYAGWAAGQLEDELERDDWIVEPARVEDVFSDSPEQLWASVLERKGGSYRFMVSMPDDPTLN